ncbi:MAG: DUF5320 domain-containing protein [Maledivibacter sp.]|jgi:hypothetical protein|nr:DUF5320 domain-containing protein [Maledivibacter sp.]
MPRYDGTGPMGKGTGTGRGLGQCTNGKEFIFSKGRGGRAGTGCRRGFGRYFYNDKLDPKIEKAILEKEKEDLQMELKNIEDALRNYEEDKG